MEELKIVILKNKKVILAAIIAIPIVIIALICIFNVKTDPFNYTELTFSGLNGQGKASVVFDKDSMIEELIGEKPEYDIFSDEKETAKYKKWDKYYEGYSRYIDYSIDKYSGLSNGDTVKVTFEITSKKAKEKIKSSRYQDCKRQHRLMLLKI